MFNFPFNNRPMAFSDRKPQRNNSDVDKSISEKELNLKNLSPELSMLLSLTLKDKQNNNILPILESIEPFLEQKDRQSIGGILGMQDQMNRLDMYDNTHSMNTGYQNLSENDKMMSLLHELTRFAGNDAKGIMGQMENAMTQQFEMGKMMKRMENMKDTKTNDPMAMFEMLSMFMPKGQNGGFGNIQNMMSLFKNMSGKDMSGFMNNFIGK